MPLSFNYADVHNKDVVCTDPNDPDKYHPVFNALIWLSMICGYNQITKKTYAKVYERIAMYEQVSGAFLSRSDDDGKPVPVRITEDDVALYIGMTTNASTLTDAEWVKKVAKLARDRGMTEAQFQGASAYALCITHEEPASV